MSRDHRRLRVFQDAHQLTLAIYRHTKHFPRDEWFGVRLQMRRAAVSVSGNIVEGNARRGTREYVSFLNIARGSSGELSYLIELTSELEYLENAAVKELDERCGRVIRQIEALIRKMELLLATERAR
jgi:four helix bundle protein